MEKEEFVKLLENKGYMAKNENSVVVIHVNNISNDRERNNVLSTIKSLVEECEYTGSYGIKYSTSKTSGNSDETDKNISTNSKNNDFEHEDEIDGMDEDESGQISFQL